MKEFIKVVVIVSAFFLISLVVYEVFDLDQEYLSTNLEENSNPVEYKAKIVQDISTYKSDIEGVKYQKVRVKILEDGQYKDKEYEAEYILQILDSAESKELEVGRNVYIIFDDSIPNVERVMVKDVDRSMYLILIVIIFIGIIVLIGRKQGIKTVISLGITLWSIFYILIPMITHGYSSIITSVVVCLIIAVINLILIAGFTKKSLIAIIGTISGVVVSLILALGISNLARITGLSNEEAQMLIYLTKGTSIDIYGLFFSGIIIGTVGATMDISISIASTMNELIKNSKNISTKDLIKSGLNVGKDSMGTMSNTLILAYVGEALILIMLLVVSNSNISSMINSDFIASEILRGLCGTIGMISSIPITTYIYGLIYRFFPND